MVEEKQISKDKLMKDLFRFPKETLRFILEVGRIKDDKQLILMTETLLEKDNLQYQMCSLNQEKTASVDGRKHKRLDLAMEFYAQEEDISFIIFIENQASNDRRMLLRMLEYTVATMMERFDQNEHNMNKGLPRAVPILIYIGRDSCNMATDLEEYYRSRIMSDQVGLEFKVHLVDLGGREYRQVLNSSTPGVFLQIMKAVYTGDREQFSELRKALEENLSKGTIEVERYYHEQLALLLGDFADYFAGESDLNDEEVETMGLSVREFLQNEARKDYEKGREEGKAEGKAEGELMGRIEGFIEALIHADLEEKFILDNVMDRFLLDGLEAGKIYQKVKEKSNS